MTAAKAVEQEHNNEKRVCAESQHSFGFICLLRDADARLVGFKCHFLNGHASKPPIRQYPILREIAETRNNPKMMVMMKKQAAEKRIVEFN